MDSISQGEKVNSAAIVRDVYSPSPEVITPRDAHQEIGPAIHDDGNQRVVEEDCDLQIVKALLVRSDRKWEFRWRGVRFSAPVLDKKFYDEFFAHRITIASGDEFKVCLVIRQTQDNDTGINANIGYEVIEAYRHIPRVQ